ncbi:hypothetical protein DV735_g3930, partial [Chaetothyriales sp. CBS 134920]
MATNSEPDAQQNTTTPHRDSQTAADFINQQLSLEQDAREVLPYKFDKCTAHLGPLRQEVYACLTCSPPPASAAQVYQPAGVCYACSISCHGEHTLVELFNRRNFVCDCGTTRFPDTSPCTLRSSLETGSRGAHSEEPAKENTYNQNFQNRFCACGQEYDAETEKGTMFQCIGLGTVDTGGCGEDWYHPECLMGLPASDSQPPPPGFPHEGDFDALVCYKCVESNPWIKRYAGTPGFLPPVFRHEAGTPAADSSSTPRPNLKRKASAEDTHLAKRAKEEEQDDTASAAAAPAAALPKSEQTAPAPESAGDAQPAAAEHKHSALPQAPTGTFSLFLKSDFRDHLCHCPTCFPHLLPHPQLLDEEDTASLLERGEAALNNIDRVRAIEGVMVYNHLRDKVKAFLKPYAESGKVVMAEDIKKYFEDLRGDQPGIQAAGMKPVPATKQTEALITEGSRVGIE